MKRAGATSKSSLTTVLRRRLRRSPYQAERISAENAAFIISWKRRIPSVRHKALRVCFGRVRFGPMYAESSICRFARCPWFRRVGRSSDGLAETQAPTSTSVHPTWYGSRVRLPLQHTGRFRFGRPAIRCNTLHPSIFRAIPFLHLPFIPLFFLPPSVVFHSSFHSSLPFHFLESIPFHFLPLRPFHCPFLSAGSSLRLKFPLHFPFSSVDSHCAGGWPFSAQTVMKAEDGLVIHTRVRMKSGASRCLRLSFACRPSRTICHPPNVAEMQALRTADADSSTSGPKPDS